MNYLESILAIIAISRHSKNKDISKTEKIFQDLFLHFMFFFSFHLGFPVRQDYFTHFELSKLNREILEKTDPRGNKHLTTRKQNLACLT